MSMKEVSYHSLGLIYTPGGFSAKGLSAVEVNTDFAGKDLFQSHLLKMPLKAQQSYLSQKFRFFEISQSPLQLMLRLKGLLGGGGGMSRPSSQVSPDFSTNRVLQQEIELEIEQTSILDILVTLFVREKLEEDDLDYLLELLKGEKRDEMITQTLLRLLRNKVGSMSLKFIQVYCLTLQLTSRNSAFELSLDKLFEELSDPIIQFLVSQKELDNRTDVLKEYFLSYVATIYETMGLMNLQRRTIGSAFLIKMKQHEIRLQDFLTHSNLQLASSVAYVIQAMYTIPIQYQLLYFIRGPVRHGFDPIGTFERDLVHTPNDIEERFRSYARVASYPFIFSEGRKAWYEVVQVARYYIKLGGFNELTRRLERSKPDLNNPYVLSLVLRILEKGLSSQHGPEIKQEWLNMIVKILLDYGPLTNDERVTENAFQLLLGGGGIKLLEARLEKLKNDNESSLTLLRLLKLLENALVNQKELERKRECINLIALIFSDFSPLTLNVKVLTETYMTIRKLMNSTDEICREIFFERVIMIKILPPANFMNFTSESLYSTDIPSDRLSNNFSFPLLASPNR